MTTQPSLDPRINPWKRGDVCTRHFDDVGFVVNCTKECIEVRWLERGAMGAVEKISADEMNNLRVGHADGPSLDGRGRTNLEALLSLEALDVIQSALANRAFKNDREKHEADEFVRRAFHGCAWDKKNAAQLLTLVVKPEQVSLLFRVRERLHRLICNQSRHQ